MPNPELDSASGIGFEYGYRVSEDFEARFSFSHLNIDTESKGFDVSSGSNTALDLLYFPYQKNLYLLAGANFLDVDESNLSAGLGIGYRYYFSSNSAFYIEGQNQYQLDNDYFDLVTKIGFVYYFGQESKAIKRAPTKTVFTSPVAERKSTIKDTDGDGIKDSKDNCPNTPVSDKVDVYGCTVFASEQVTMSLKVNFDHDKYDVKARYFDDIKVAADFLNRYPHLSLTVNGHTSSLGDETYNQQLSEKRAQAIVEVLITKFNIGEDRLSAVGYGETQLLDSANTSSAHDKNRRIEASLQVNEKRALKR